MKTLVVALLFAASLQAQMKVVALPSKSPLVTFRVVFTTGAASDPVDKPGLADLTASLMAQGGTKDLTYKQVKEALFPMAAHISSQVDKEMTTFYGQTHVDNLNAYYKVFKAVLLEPGWREEDFQRVKQDTINYLRVSLRGNNDEELAKEVLYNEIFEGHPYGHHNGGTVSSLEKITLDDVKSFYRTHYAVSNLILGIAGGYPPTFRSKITLDLQKALPPRATFHARMGQPKQIEHTRAVVIQKDTRSVAYSIGFPIGVSRGTPDYVALLLTQSCFGQHRLSGRRLYQRMREERGLNYGDYAYIEYFPNGMFQFEPSPNLARHFQIFQMWIRPVEPPTAHFALRLAMFELNRLVKDGITKEEFETTRSFLGKYANLLTKTKSSELGYRIDSEFYNIRDYGTYLRTELAKLTLEQVNSAIRRRLHTDRLIIVAVAQDAEGLRKQFLGNEPSPMHYNSPKRQEILDEDKIVESLPLNLRLEDISIVPVEKVFE